MVIGSLGRYRPQLPPQVFSKPCALCSSYTCDGYCDKKKPAKEPKP